MTRLTPYIAVIALAAAAAGCNKGTGTAYNNSGTSATPGSTTSVATTPATDTSSPASSTATTTTSADSPNVVADTVTSGKIMAALVADPALKDSDIAVKTDAGVVVLTGTAKSQDQVAMATQLAQKQEGVTRVESQVTVR